MYHCDTASVYIMCLYGRLLARMSRLSVFVLHYGSKYFIGLNKKENAPNKSSVHLDFVVALI